MLVASAPFSWEVDAVGFYRQYHNFFLAAAIAYYPVIFGIKSFLSTREPFDLGGGKSKCRFNWIFWYIYAPPHSVV